MGHFLRTLTILLLLAAVAPAEAAAIKHVIVIAMENKDAKAIYDSAAAPYIHGTLLKAGARADNFTDPLPDNRPFSFYYSEPHYVWMEAGTNKFGNFEFKGDGDPGAKNITLSKDHLVNQLEQAGISWMTYQEGIGTSPTCPIVSFDSGRYAAKHNPFVFFADIAGNPPTRSSQRCIDHTRDLSALTADLENGTLAQYVFISPNLCNDMHGYFKILGADPCKAYYDALCGAVPADPRCAMKYNKDMIAFGDGFLKATLPAMIDWANQNGGVIFVVWDEGAGGNLLPFIAAGSGIKPGGRTSEAYNHGSVIRTVEKVFGVPALDAVKDAKDLSDLFMPGAFP